MEAHFQLQTSAYIYPVRERERFISASLLSWAFYKDYPHTHLTEQCNKETVTERWVCEDELQRQRKNWCTKDLMRAAVALIRRNMESSISKWTKVELQFIAKGFTPSLSFIHNTHQQCHWVASRGTWDSVSLLLISLAFMTSVFWQSNLYCFCCLFFFKGPSFTISFTLLSGIYIDKLHLYYNTALMPCWQTRKSQQNLLLFRLGSIYASFHDGYSICLPRSDCI